MLNEKSQGIKVEGFYGTWYVIDVRAGETGSMFLLEHEEYGDEAASIIIDQNGKLLLDEVYNGFDDWDEYCELKRGFWD